MNFIKKITLFIFVGTSCLASTEYAEVHNKEPFNAIVFDIGDILFKADQTVAASMSWRQALACFASTWENPFNTKKKFFALLSSMQSNHTQSNQPRATHRGDALPPIMEEWLCAGSSCEDILARVHAHFDTILTNQAERNLFKTIAPITFDPKMHIKLIKPIPGGIALVKALYNTRDENGVRNKLFILSNYNGQAFDELYAQHKEFFDHYFEGMIISGKENPIRLGQLPLPAQPTTANQATEDETTPAPLGMKPRPEIYGALKDNPYWSIDEKRCFFIDDQKENVIAARNAGITAFHCPNYDYDGIYQKLITAGLIKNPKVSATLVPMDKRKIALGVVFALYLAHRAVNALSSHSLI